MTNVFLNFCFGLFKKVTLSHDLALTITRKHECFKFKRTRYLNLMYTCIITLNEYFLSLNFWTLLSILKSIAIIEQIEIH